jgi:hypothetical protein
VAKWRSGRVVICGRCGAWWGGLLRLVLSGWGESSGEGWCLGLGLGDFGRGAVEGARVWAGLLRRGVLGAWGLGWAFFRRGGDVGARSVDGLRGRGFGGVGLLGRVGGSRGGVEVGDLEEKRASAAGVLALLLGEQGTLGGVADGDAARGLGVILDHAGQSVDGAGKQSDGGDAGAGRGEGFEFVDVALGSGFGVPRAQVRELEIESHGDLVDREVGFGEELEE